MDDFPNEIGKGNKETSYDITKDNCKDESHISEDEIKNILKKI